MDTFKPIDKRYLQEQLETLNNKIEALHKEQSSANLQRSIIITKVLSILELKRRSLRCRLESGNTSSGIKEHTILKS